MRAALNGVIIDAGAACLPLSERGFLYGDGCFDTFRFCRGRVFLKELHFRRLSETALALGLPAPDPSLYALAEELSAQNGHLEGAGRITFTRGSHGVGPKPQSAGTPTTLVTTRPLPANLPGLKRFGKKAATVGRPLRAGGGLFPEGHKTLSYLSGVWALGAVGEGVEPLLETVGGHLSEGATSNLFWAKGGRLFTPSLATGCLPGIARGVIVDLAGRVKIEVAEGKFKVDELISADEAFLTNSVTGIIPVSEVDRQKIGPSLPGPLTLLLSKRLAELEKAFSGSCP